MREERRYYVYILGSYSGTLYIGVTGNLHRRGWQHKEEITEGFTKRYGVTHLLHAETFREVLNAIAREKQLKGWTRAQKIKLIEARNPRREDLSRDWYSSSEEELLARFRQTTRPSE